MDEATLREFVTTEYPRLVGALSLVSGSRAAAEDAVQEALARAWERSRRGEAIDSLVAWVTTVSLNLARGTLRRLRAERRALDRLVRSRPELREAAEMSRAPDLVDLRRALASLPRREREATVLRYYLGLDVAEVARVMQAPEGTVKSLLHRARAALFASLGPDELEEVNEGGEARG